MADRIATKGYVTEKYEHSPVSVADFLADETDGRCPTLSELTAEDNPCATKVDTGTNSYRNNELVREDDIQFPSTTFRCYFNPEDDADYYDDGEYYLLADGASTSYLADEGKAYKYNTYYKMLDGIQYTNTSGRLVYVNDAQGGQSSQTLAIYSRQEGSWVYMTAFACSRLTLTNNLNLQMPSPEQTLLFTARNTYGETVVFFSRPLKSDDEELGGVTDVFALLETIRSQTFALDANETRQVYVNEGGMNQYAMTVVSGITDNETIQTDSVQWRSNRYCPYPYYLTYIDTNQGYRWRCAYDNFEGLSPEYGGDGDDNEYYYGLYLNNVDDGWGAGYGTSFSFSLWPFYPANPKDWGE